MTNIGEKAASFRFIDNPHAPEVFADAVTGYFVQNGNLHLTFESLRVEHSSPTGAINRVVVGRLVMPLAAVSGLTQGLADFLANLGAAPVASQGSPTLQ